MRIIEKWACILCMVFILWLLLSWINVISHNDPGDAVGPASWNAFVVISEFRK